MAKTFFNPYISPALYNLDTSSLTPVATNTVRNGTLGNINVAKAYADAQNIANSMASNTDYIASLAPKQAAQSAITIDPLVKKTNDATPKTNPWQQAGAAGLSAIGNLGSLYLVNSFDTEGGQAIGNLLSTGVNAAFSTMGNNLMSGNNVMQGVGANVGSSLASAGMGLAGYYAGKGITEAMGDTKLARGVGAGTASAIGLFGGTALGNLVAGNGFNLQGANPYLMAANVAGAGLGAYAGPSKEYAGKYGKITKGMDIGYDAVQTVASAIPGWGQIMAAAMAVNGGLMNMFGSTSGMTKTDAILGSKFMPFFIKWANMANAKTTDSFANQSWLNEELTNSFMQNGFGDLADVFDKARVEANKTYGTFSNKLFNKALQNMMYANLSWNDVLNMSKQNRWQNIRSLDMTSINNQRYAQNIQGGFNPIYRGKQGMKILNNATNHNIGMRLLSTAALIDSKQMILSALTGIKLDLPEGFLFDTQMPELTVYGDVERARRQNNWLINRGQFPKFYSFGNGKGVKEIKTPTEKGLEIVSPEFYALAGLRPGGDIIAPITKNQIKNIGKAVIKQTTKHSIITPENAASITPEQWTVAQDAAIARGDMAEAQRLRDLHFKISAPNTQIKDIQYHGAKGNAIFNVFDPKLIGQTDQGWAGRGYYFTPSIDYAKMYGSEPRAFYINAQKVHDGTASTYFGRENSPAANAFKIIRKRHGNDGQLILDKLAASDAIRTSFPQTRPYNGIFEEVVTRNNNQMKLADAVTYDDNGVRIPLGERDNFKLNDIRYGLLPFAGITGAATLYNKSK